MKRILTYVAGFCLALAGASVALAGVEPQQALALASQPIDPHLLAVVGFGGMIVNKSSLSEIFINLKTLFNNALKIASTKWQLIALKVPSGSALNNYKWLSQFPGMKKWIGEKQIKSLEGFNYTIVNDDWEATIEVDRNDIEDDNLGIYAPQATMAGDSAGSLPDEIVADLVNGAFAAKCYDGQFFFDTDHPVGNGVKSNKGTAHLSADTPALALASYGAARTALMKMTNDEGRPLNITPDILLLPPALEAVGNVLMTADKLNDNSPNPYKGTAKVVVWPRLTSDTAWFLLCTDKAVKPFIYQERKPPYFVQQTNMDSDNVFMNKKYRYGVEARAAGGYGFWQLAFGSDGTT